MPNGYGSHLQPSELRQKWHIYTPDELDRRCAELGNSRDLIEGLIPDRSLGIVVGDSGLGKTPFLPPLRNLWVSQEGSE